MAASWRAGVLQQAEQVWDALRRLASSGLEFLNAELGLALEVEPQVLSAVTAGFLLLLLLATVCAAAACGAALRRRRRRTNVRVGTKTRESNDRVNVNDAEIATDSGKIPPVKTGKPEEPKKKNKKKATEKQKTQPNGRTVPEVREEIKAVQELPKQAAVPTPPQPQPPPQPPADNKADKAKKNKKKPKPEVKQNQNVLTTEVKEPDEGAWETKISNREKRQQRRKEKGPGDDSGSPGGGNHVGQQVEQPVVKVSITAKKNKESLNSKIEKAEKRNAIIAPASTWNPVTSGGWAEISAKPPTQVSAPDGEKWSVGKKTSGHRNSEPLAWGQETDGSWTGTVMGDRIKAELNPVSFSMVGLNPSAKDPAAELGKWDSLNTADNEWSGSNGLEAVDPSSDWNAPSELWGNFEEPKAAKPAAQETPVSQPARLQDSDDDKEKGDSGSKSKRKKKKKKKPEEENAVSQVNTENLPTAADIKTHPHVLQEEPTKQNVTQPSSQKKTDQNREPPKQAQKKKARRET
ncbi:metadherin a isoform X3 [Hoplias malabaricus]|uniref:metadherin a isoform X3 n=1 Tax=Hoplias malabaricus TaxID=27720 RepID=UPI0034631D48